MYRLAALVTVALVACAVPAFADESEGAFFTVWGVAHVGVSLAGTVFLIWLVRRGVDKL